ncbi:MAG: hypothetical protein ACOY0T_03375 [Myxococcota bacterium]
MKAFRRTLPLWLLVAASAVACSGDKAPARGQIMLALQTDMALPKDVSKVKLQVLTAGTKDAGVVKYDRTFTVGANGEAKIPATFAIVAPEGQSPTVEVRVIGIGGNKARTFSKVVTTVPRDRIATLNMPIQWLCDGTANTIDASTESYESTCPPKGEIETACVAGTCQDVNFPEAKMPTFSAPDVFGGGKDAMDPVGKCFDTVACFDPGFDVTPDAACRVRVSAPPLRPLNFSVRPTAANEGICGGKGCYVPLDQSETFGWTELSRTGGGGGEGGESSIGGGGAGGDSGQPDFGSGSVERTIQLPRAVCERLADGRIRAVRASASCDLKTERVPVCGDWYSVQAQRVTPETSMNVGNGMMNGGSCPEFRPGTAIPDISDDSVLNGTLQAAAELKVQSDELARETYEACAGIITDLGGTPPSTTQPPLPATVTNTCNAAQAALMAAGGNSIGSAWSVLVTPGKCAVSIDEQATCESACPQTGCAGAPTPDLRCASLGGTCEGSCSGQCSGSRDAPVSCNGSCDGVCMGTCQGSCVLPDGTQGNANCAGWCTGTCNGTCAGSCAQESATCEGACWIEGGDCIGRLTNLLCDGPLTNEPCYGNCGTLCAAHTSLHQICQSPLAEVYGDAPQLVRMALDSHYWKLLDVLHRSTGLTSAGPLINQLYGVYASDSATVNNAHTRACLNAAQMAINSASASMSASITAASQTATAVASGGNVGGMCQPSEADTNCSRCVKATCCSQFGTCSTDPACGGNTGSTSAGEFNCVTNCYLAGGNASTCEQGSACKISASASFSPATLGLLSCAHETCQSSCFAPNCGSNQLPCNGVCVNALSDIANCGGCARACAPGQVCTEGTCLCPGGLTFCSGRCVDTSTDRSNCGVCNAICGGTQTCVAGKCVNNTGGGGASGLGGAGGNIGAGGAVPPGGAGGAFGAGGTFPSGGNFGAGGTFPSGGTGGFVSGNAGTGGVGAPPCPATQPQPGTSCPSLSQRCNYTGGYICTCTADGWQCILG